MGKAKKIGIGILVIVGFFVILIGSVIAWQTLNPEELAELRAEAAERKAIEERLEQAKLRVEEKQQADPFLDAKKELNNYLQSLKKTTSDCNRLPVSVKISSLVEKDANEIVANSVLMILLIEEAPIDSGLLLYKQKIITAVDELTKCLNRH